MNFKVLNPSLCLCLEQKNNTDLFWLNTFLSLVFAATFFPNVSCVAKLCCFLFVVRFFFLIVVCISAVWVDSGDRHQHLDF